MTVWDRPRGDGGPDFPRNLRYLCSFARSTSEVCRRIGINRQQFNKYLAGLSRPSSRNMRRICDHFGVEEYEILAPHGELRKILQVKGVRPGLDDQQGAEPDALARIGAALRDGQGGLARYFGYYYGYYYSFSYPGRILKSLLRLADGDGVAGYKRIERLVDREAPGPDAFVFKYQGVALLLRDRIFLIDREALTGNEVSQTILYPSYKNKLDLLPGLTLGTSGKTSREPICSRIVLQFLGESVDLKARMSSCGLYGAHSSAIAPEVRASIANRIPEGSFSLRAEPL